MSIEDQPPPKKSNHPASWDLVIADVATARQAVAQSRVVGSERMIEVIDLTLHDMRERDQLGEKRYGVRLAAGNGRDHLIDAYQEALDLAVYLRTDLEENGESPSRLLYNGTIQMIITLRFMIAERPKATS